MADAVFSLENYTKLARQAAAEGVVLLRNENQVLPLREGATIALFGRNQTCYYKSGTGSGGLVNAPYVVGIREALEKDGRFCLAGVLTEAYDAWVAEHPFDEGNGWAQEPWYQEEMPLSGALIREARKKTDLALILLGRTAGEDKDSKAEPGSYYLTEAEERMLSETRKAFPRMVVLLNTGGIMDMSWVSRFQPDAVLYVWQGGQEGGNGVADILSGAVSPCGRLPDTIARDLSDYPAAGHFGDPARNFYEEDIYVGYRYFSTFTPENVLYPFGFGLSYTTFETEALLTEHRADGLLFQVTARNTGSRPAKAVPQLYAEAPQGLLGKPSRSLCAFAKTEVLAPGEAVSLSLFVPFRRLASYDAGGETGERSCFVMEAGTYRFYAGDNVRDAVFAAAFALKETKVIERLEEAAAPVTQFSCLRPGAGRADGSYEKSRAEVPLRQKDPARRRRERRPETYVYTGDRGLVLEDAAADQQKMRAFLAQLTNEELFCLARGEGMCSPKVTPGTAGAFGGVTEALRHYGIPLGCCADGPAGIRMDCGTPAFSLPNGTCLAATFNESLLEALFTQTGLELRKNHIDVLLGPGMNIHRHPLNGRNFEYFSEDPLLSGKMAAAEIRGLRRAGVTGTLKHFACNNQEYERFFAEAVVSERALREIYLAGFEIAVKEAKATAVMSTYGPVNGFWTSSHYDLLTTILRGEWGFDGVVMSDWWALGNDEGKAPSKQNLAAMIRAQNDLYMVTEDALKNTTGDNAAEALARGAVTRGEFQRSAANICRFLLGSPARLRFKGEKSALDLALAETEGPSPKEDGEVLSAALTKGHARVPLLGADTSKGRRLTLSLRDAVPGTYTLTLRGFVSPQSPDQAQLPVSVFADGKLAGILTFTGADKASSEKSLTFFAPAPEGLLSVGFFFGMSGLAPEEAVFSRID